MSDISHKIYIFFAQISWPLGPLVSVVDFEPKKFWVQAPNRPEKKNKKSKTTRRSEIRIKFFTDSIRNQQLKLRAGILRVILSDRNFRFYKKTYEIPPEAETGEIFEVSGKN
jgi:hypothetical protein